MHNAVQVTWLSSDSHDAARQQLQVFDSVLVKVSVRVLARSLFKRHGREATF